MSLRINSNSNRILDELERPKTSDLTSYNYLYWKKKGILKLGARNIEKPPPSLTFDSEAVYTKDLSNIRRPLLIFVVGNCI